MVINMTLFFIFCMDRANQAGTAFGDAEQKKHALKESTKNTHEILSAPHSETPDTKPPEEVTFMQIKRKEKQAEALHELEGDRLVEHMVTQGDALVNNPAGTLRIGIRSHNNTEEIVDCTEPVNKTTYTYPTYERRLQLNIFHQDQIKKKRCVRKIKRCTSWWGDHSDDSPSCDTYRWIRNVETRDIETGQDCERTLGWRYYDSDIVETQSERTECTSEYWQIHDPLNLVARVKNNECSVVKAEALRGRNTEYHYGKGFTRDLWHQRITVMCPDPVSKRPNPCLELRKKGCEEISSRAAYGFDGQCSSYAKKYRCPTRQESTIDAGPGGIHCIDGGNLVKQYEKYDDMADALAQLNILSEMQKQVKDWNTAEVFKGQVNKCKKNILENVLYDCCSSLDGFAISLCLTNCNAEERELAKRKAEGKCHYVGSIQNEIIAGFHSSDSQVYCCFDSKLMAILQKEARRQLGRSFGTPHKPDCGGLSIAEIGSLDFSRMDLSELFDDVMTKAKKGAERADTTNLKSRMQDKLRILNYKPRERGAA